MFETTTEDLETMNEVREPLVQPLTPYSSSFNYVYSKRGRSLENTPTRFKERELEEQHSPSFKQRKAEKLVNSSLDKDSLLFALSLLDLKSLVKCTLVAKSLRTMILSSELKRLWSKNQPPVVLLSSYTLPCKLWMPGESSSSVSVFQPLMGSNDQLVVASHRGLVCVRLLSTSDGYQDLAVGNPLTGEWVALPRSLMFWELPGHRYDMEVEEPCFKDRSVAPRFKVAVFVVDDCKYSYHVFDSASGEWSITQMLFPPRTSYRWSAFDLGSSTWKTHLIRKQVIRTGLERRASDVHQLPHPYLHGFSRWEYKGSSYFASAWIVDQPRYEPKEDSAGEFAGYGVWKVVASNDGEHLETVAAVWGSDVEASQAAIRLNVWVECTGVSCYARANVVCFAGESKGSPSMPVVVYDIDTGKWTSFNEQHPPPEDVCLPQDHYGAAVVYSPSLLVAPPGICRKFSPEADKESHRLDSENAW